jgi:hypothetical protein
MHRVKIRNLFYSSTTGEDEYYEGPSVREAKLSLAQDITLLNNLPMSAIFSALVRGLDYEIVREE